MKNITWLMAHKKVNNDHILQNRDPTKLLCPTDVLCTKSASFKYASNKTMPQWSTLPKKPTKSLT